MVAQGFCFQNRYTRDHLSIHSVHCSIVPSTSRQTMDQLCTVEIGKQKKTSLTIGATEQEILKTEIKFLLQSNKLNFTSPLDFYAYNS